MKKFFARWFVFFKTLWTNWIFLSLVALRLIGDASWPHKIFFIIGLAIFFATLAVWIVPSLWKLEAEKQKERADPPKTT